MTETEARTFLNRYFTAAMQSTDLDEYTAMLTEDCVLEDPVGTPPLRGRAAIREFLAAGRERIAGANWTVHEVMACGREVAARWSCALRFVSGGEHTVDGIGVFTFAESACVCHIREFYDASFFARMFAGTAA